MSESCRSYGHTGTYLGASEKAPSNGLVLRDDSVVRMTPTTWSGRVLLRYEPCVAQVCAGRLRPWIPSFDTTSIIIGWSAGLFAPVWALPGMFARKFTRQIRVLLRSVLGDRGRTPIGHP